MRNTYFSMRGGAGQCPGIACTRRALRLRSVPRLPTQTKQERPWQSLVCAADQPRLGRVRIVQAGHLEGSQHKRSLQTRI